MLIRYKTITIAISCLLYSTLPVSCRKLVSIPPPKNTISTTQVFDTDVQAEGAMAGIYTRMINGDDQTFPYAAARNIWSAGLINLLGSLSSGEVYNADGPATPDYYFFSTNRLNINTSGTLFKLWTTAYNTIY